MLNAMLLAWLVAAAPFQAAPSSDAPSPQVAPARTASPLPRVALDTSAGRMVIEVDTAHAPISGGNFLRYVDRHLLDGSSFYRRLKVQDHFGFIQFGSNGVVAKSLPPIKHEPTTVTGIRHTDYTVSTARLAPGTARGEFTVSIGDQPSFDADPSRPGDNAGYAAFGHVVEGQDVALRIFDAPNSPTATLRGSFKGEVPAAPVRIVSARRIRP